VAFSIVNIFVFILAFLSAGVAESAPGNLAQGRPVVVSSQNPDLPKARAVDGNLTSRWGSADGSDLQWIYVDLGAVTSIDRVILDWEQAAAKVYQLQVSNDATNWTTVFTETNGARGLADIRFAAVNARYVRMYATQPATPWGYSLWEFEVYRAGGTQPPRLSPPPPPNLAQGRPVAVSSAPASGLRKELAVDGNPGTRWGSAEGVDPQWIYVDLGSVTAINRVILDWELAAAKAYQLQVSNDAANWTTVFTETNGDRRVDDISFAAVNARYVRMYGTQRTTPYGYGVFEFEVYGTGGAPAPSELTTVSVAPSTSTVAVGDTQTFVAAGKDQYGGSYSTPVTWDVSGGGTIDISSGVFTASTAGGPFTVTATSTLNTGISGTAKVTVSGVPELTTVNVAPATATVTVGDTRTFVANGLDQFGDPFPTSVTWDVAGGGTIDSGGVFTASTAGGPFTVTATSTLDTSINGTGKVTVVAPANQAPAPTAPAIITNEDTAGTSQVLPNDPDSGDTHTYAVTGQGSNGTASVSGSGLVTYTPNLNFTGSDSVTVTVTDSGSLSAPVVISVTVNAQSDPPVAVGTIAAQSGSEGSAFGPLDVSANFSDPDSPLTYSLSGLPAGTGVVINSGTSVISGTPTDADAQASPITVTVLATDGGTPASQQFALTIGDINSAPAFTSTAVTAATQDVAYSYDITTSDADSADMHTITSNALPAWLTLTDNGDGTATLSGTPTSADLASGTFDVVLTVTDSGTGNLTGTQSFTINLTNVNDAPTATAGGIILIQGSTGTVQVNVSDPDAGDTFTYAVSQQTTTVGGTASIDTNGLVTYDANGATAGSDSIEVTVTDQGGVGASDAVSIPVTVNATGETDSNGDGVTDTQATDLGLDPNDADGDTDGDGLSDANEIGDPANPADSDGDGVIDALENGANASDASTANGLQLDSGDTVEITSSGQALSNVATGPVTGGPAGISFPFGTVSYTSTSVVGGSITVRMTFSADLPSDLAIFKVDNAGTFTELPTSAWTQVDARTVDLTLTDGDPATDLDGIANGSIVDPVAIASAPAPTSDSGGGGGGCTLSNTGSMARDPLMPIMMLGALVMLNRRRRTTALR